MSLAFNDRYQTSTPVVSTSVFTIDFPIYSLTSDVTVYIDGVETSAFGITGTAVNGAFSSATLTLTTAIVNQTIEIVGTRQPARPDDLINGPSLIANMNADRDRDAAERQEIYRDVRRSLRLPYGTAVTVGDLSAPSGGKYLQWNAAGTSLIYADLPTLSSQPNLTLAQVGATDLTDYTFIVTTGYSTEGDGGGGFYTKTGGEPAHEAKVQSADGAWWELVYAPDGANVLAFGAKGTGITADAAANDTAFAAAIAYVASLGGGTIVIPGGRYKFASAISITSDGIRVIGHGQQDTLLDFSTASGTNGLEITGGVDYFVLEGFRIQSADLDGIKFSDIGGNPSRGTIRDVATKFHGQHGFYAEGLFLCDMTNLHSQGNTGKGIYFGGYHTTIVANACQAIGNTDGGWYLNDVGYSAFNGCAADQNGGHGWEVHQTIASFDGCGAESNTGSGFRLVGDSGGTMTGVIATFSGGLAFNNDSVGAGANFFDIDGTLANVRLVISNCRDLTASGGISNAVTGANVHLYETGCVWAATNGLMNDRSPDEVVRVNGWVRMNGLSVRPAAEDTDGTLSPDLANGGVFVERITIGSTVTINAPTNTVNDGAYFEVVLDADGTTISTINWNAAYKFAGAAGPSSVTSGRRTSVLFRKAGANYEEVSRSENIG